MWNNVLIYTGIVTVALVLATLLAMLLDLALGINLTDTPILYMSISTPINIFLIHRLISNVVID